VVAGTFFLVPIAFSGFFVYDNTIMSIGGAGLGTVFLLAGISMWVNEGLTQTPLIAGVANIGLPIFILSEVFIFLSLFASYWLMRLGFDTWPPEGTPEIIKWVPLVMTVILVSSSVTIHIGEEKLEHGDLSGFNTWLIITIVLGVIFLGFTAYEYNHMIHEGFVPSTNVYSTAFYTITGFHASHVFAGLGAFVAVLIPALGGRTNKTFVTCVSVYWHFVDIVWFFVASQIYFW
jgi:cytochrome c oxidase subunit 3